MYYSLAPSIKGKRGEPIKRGDHYDVTRYLSIIHDDIRKKYLLRNGEPANTQKAYNIEYALNMIYNPPELNKKNAIDLMIRNQIIEQYIPKEVQEKIATFKTRYQDIIKNNENYSTKLGKALEEDLSSFTDSIFSGKSLRGSDKIFGPEQANIWLGKLKKEYKILQDYIAYRVGHIIAGSSDIKKNHSPSDEIRKYASYELGLEIKGAKYISGDKQELIDYRQGISDYMKNFFKDFPISGKEKEEFLLLLSTAPGKMTINDSAQGKIDLSVDNNSLNILGSFDITAQASSRLLKGLQAMQGANFSLKVTNKIKSVKLGNTNFMRVYFDFLPTFRSHGGSESLVSGYSHLLYLMRKSVRSPGQISKNRWYYNQYGGKNETVKERWDIIREKVYYIRLMYELTGSGQIYSSGPFTGLKKSNDYLIYTSFNWDKKNKKTSITSTNIKVRSASQILFKMMQYANQRAQGDKGFQEVGQNPFVDPIEVDPSAFF